MAGASPHARLGLYSTAVDEVDKSVKRQRVTGAKVDACISSLIQQVSQARDALLQGTSAGPVMMQLGKQADAAFKEANGATKDLHQAVNKLGKAVDACVDDAADVTKVMRDVQMDTRTLHLVLAEHFFRQGRFQVGYALVREAGLESAGRDLAAPFTDMHTVLEQLHECNPRPALEWADAQLALFEPGADSTANMGAGPGNRPDAPTPAQPSTTGGAVPHFPGTAAPVTRPSVGPRSAGAVRTSIQGFQMRLYALSFLATLTHQGQGAALEYARLHFPPFSRSHMRDIQQLMGCLVFSRAAHAPQPSGADAGPSEPAPMAVSPPPQDPQPAAPVADVAMTDAHAGPSEAVARWTAGCRVLAGTPYAHLMSRNAWQQVAQEFMRLACSLKGLPAESPLATVLAAGAAALPRLHKLMSVLTPAVAAEMRAATQLPVELDLGSEFVFHPIFACPVSRDQSSPENPPLLLPCNHVLCEQSVFKIAKSRTRVFKCPYCPVEARTDNLRPLVFPTVD